MSEAKTDETPPFEKGLERLEAVVKELDGGDLPLERAIELFEKGTAMAETCRAQLAEAETKVEILTKRGSRVEAQPFQR